MKRQSTTQKLTRQLLDTLRDCFAIGEGVIIRFAGKEYAAINMTITGGQNCIVTLCGQVIPVTRCTIRKGLQRAVQSDRNQSTRQRIMIDHLITNTSPGPLTCWHSIADGQHFLTRSTLIAALKEGIKLN